MKKLLLLGTITVCSFSAFAQELYYYPSQNQQPIYFYQPTQIPQTQYVQTYTNPVKYKPIQSDFTKKNTTKPYISAKIKHVSMDATAKLGDSFDVSDDVFGGAIAFGLEHKGITGSLRGEIEYNKNATTKKDHNITYIDYDYGYFAEGKAKFEIESHAFMFNTYYNFETGAKISPYVGTGIGLSQIKGNLKIEDFGISESIKKTNFSWQIGAGISLNLTNNFSLDTGYRYFDYGSFEKEDAKIDVSAHEIYTGARVSF